MSTTLAAFLTGSCAASPVVTPFEIEALPGVTLYCRQLRLADAAPIFSNDVSKDSIGFALRLVSMTVCDAQGRPLHTEEEWRDAVTLADQVVLQQICDKVMPIIGLPGHGDDPVERGNA